MAEGDFLIADDLGPLGRLAPKGELRVLDEEDVEVVRQERAWVGKKFTQAQHKAEALRRRLERGARLGEHGDSVLEDCRAWLIEAAKYAQCGRWLAAIEDKLRAGEKQALNTPKNFVWQSIPQVTDVVQRVINATEDEIIGGVVLRAG